MRLFACAYVRAGKKLIYTIYPRLKLYKLLLYIKYLVLYIKMDLPFNSNITRIKNHSCVNDKSGHFFILTSCDRAERCRDWLFQTERDRRVLVYVT